MVAFLKSNLKWLLFSFNYSRILPEVIQVKNYAALIMDLKKSRAYASKDRNEIQEYIIHVISVLNHVFDNALKKQVSFSDGDAVQGLFSCVEAAYLYFRLFSMLISPVEIRAGIGVGGWEVRIDDAGSTAQDGTAYHRARYAIEATEESLGYSVLLFSGGENDIVVNSLFNATALLINKQSQYQNEVMLLSELLFPINAYGIIDTCGLREIIELIGHKNDVVRYDFFKVNKGKHGPLFYRIKNFDFESQPRDAINDDDSFFVVAGRVRGLPMLLAEIIGVTRQSISKTIKAANIYEARNIAVTTLRYLKKLGEE